MSDQTEEFSSTQETSSAMPGEGAVNAGTEMEIMPDVATEGAIVERLPGEELADFASFEMPSTEGFEDTGMPATEMVESTAMSDPATSGGAMPGEEGMGMAMADFMPGEELSVREPGKTGAELTGTFRLTLIPA